MLAEVQGELRRVGGGAAVGWRAAERADTGAVNRQPPGNQAGPGRLAPDALAVHRAATVRTAPPWPPSGAQRAPETGFLPAVPGGGGQTVCRAMSPFEAKAGPVWPPRPLPRGLRLG